MQKIYREKQFSCGAQSRREGKQERSIYEADNIGRDKATECVREFPETSGVPGNLLGYPMWTNCKILIYRKDIIPEDKVPTTWDEVQFIDGYPGRYVVLARRHGQDWYVAALNAQQETLKLTVELPMLAGSSVMYYHDGKDGRTPVAEESKVAKNGKFKLTLPVNGGAILTGASVR